MNNIPQQYGTIYARSWMKLDIGIGPFAYRLSPSHPLPHNRLTSCISPIPVITSTRKVQVVGSGAYNSIGWHREIIRDCWTSRLILKGTHLNMGANFLDAWSVDRFLTFADRRYYSFAESSLRKCVQDRIMKEMLGSVKDSIGGGWKVLILDDITTRSELRHWYQSKP